MILMQFLLGLALLCGVVMMFSGYLGMTNEKYDTKYYRGVFYISTFFNALVILILTYT